MPVNWGELRDYVYASRLGPASVAEIQRKLKRLGLKVAAPGFVPEQHMWTVVYQPDTPLGSFLEKALTGQSSEVAPPANLVSLVLVGAAVTKEQELRSLRETIDRLDARVKDQDEKILALRAIIDRIKVAVADI
ncbi:hypothetical protein [Nocardia africana]|uniref:Uncharacterized protein n=1 Tax=Nocardia africana TaxID=134964 RepID=A0A378WKN3_9NOCA|nr:hypothetical protein [Nocardia africana]MCC3316489.1 hypothetical protein [Nocardia africana]SUA41155.1 Uncharacterised protein [Nocardia africana]